MLIGVELRGVIADETDSEFPDSNDQVTEQEQGEETKGHVIRSGHDVYRVVTIHTSYKVFKILRNKSHWSIT